MDPKTMVFVIDAMLAEKCQRCIDGSYTKADDSSVRCLLAQRKYWVAKMETGNGMAA